MKPEDILLDVRKSYRLLHDYQRLILDASKFIGDQLGMTYRGGFPKFSNNPPGPGRGDLGRWAWDWLGMMAHEFQFNRSIDDGDIVLSLVHLPDTGAMKLPHARRTHTEEFGNVSTSTSEVAFIYSVIPTGEDSSQHWNFTFLHNDAERLAFLEDKELPKKYTQLGMGSFFTPLHMLFDEASALQVITDLKKRFPKLTQGLPQ